MRVNFLFVLFLLVLVAVSVVSAQETEIPTYACPTAVDGRYELPVLQGEGPLAGLLKLQIICPEAFPDEENFANLLPWAEDDPEVLRSYIDPETVRRRQRFFIAVDAKPNPALATQFLQEERKFWVEEYHVEESDYDEGNGEGSGFHGQDGEGSGGDSGVSRPVTVNNTVLRSYRVGEPVTIQGVTGEEVSKLPKGIKVETDGNKIVLTASEPLSVEVIATLPSKDDNDVKYVTTVLLHFYQPTILTIYRTYIIWLCCAIILFILTYYYPYWWSLVSTGRVLHRRGWRR